MRPAIRCAGAQAWLNVRLSGNGRGGRRCPHVVTVSTQPPRRGNSSTSTSCTPYSTLRLAHSLSQAGMLLFDLGLSPHANTHPPLTHPHPNARFLSLFSSTLLSGLGPMAASAC